MIFGSLKRYHCKGRPYGLLFSMMMMVLLLNVAECYRNEYESMYKDFWERYKIEGEKIKGDFFGGDTIDLMKDMKETTINDSPTYSCLDDSTTSASDHNLRFIKGKCNPVLLVPGIYATRLLVTINCKLFKETDYDKFLQARVFCGKTICANEKSQYEEHVLFPAIYSSPFNLMESDNYSSCIGFFMKYHNNKSECPPREDGSLICEHSPAVKISYYGSTDRTVSKSRCGVAAVQNVVSTGYEDLDDFASVGAAKVFQGMSDHLKGMGYNEGFSYGAIPQDYRKFIATNHFFTKAFQYQINRLYDNTGKPVVIIAHSYGTLNTLNQLVSMDNELRKRIKTFIAIAPPFSGASKTIDFFLYGSRDFDTQITITDLDIDLIKVKFDSLGQQMNYNALPTMIELRPQPYLTNLLLNNDRYNELYLAVSELIAIEAKWSKGVIDDAIVKENMKYFDKLFGETFPLFTMEECKKHNNNLKPKPTEERNHPCSTRLFNIFKCPMVIKTSPSVSLPEVKLPLESSLESLCKVEGINERQKLLNALLFDGNCASTTTETKGKRCLDSLYNSPPYPFNSSNTKFQSLINQFNKNLSKEYNRVLKPEDPLFETKEAFQAKTQSLINYHDTISRIKDLPLPPVDTVVIYANFIPTKSAYVYEDNDQKEMFSQDDIVFRGGDETVPNWSTMLVGMKWLYDKKHLNASSKFKQKITLVEYCSLLSNERRFQYNSATGTGAGTETEADQKEYYAIGCDCFINNDPSQGYNLDKLKEKNCNHSSMINDPYLIKVIEEQYLINSSSSSSSSPMSSSVKEAIERYDSTKNYEKECNFGLKKLSDKEKRRP